MLKLLEFFTLSFCWVNCWAYPYGAPEDACISMQPSHGISRTSSLAASYSIQISQTNYSLGATITVTISGTGGAMFEGYMIQMRKEVDDSTAFGSWTTTTGQTVCSETPAVTHTSNVLKSSVQMQWTAPSSSAGNLQVWATIVKSYSFWTIIKSSVILDASSPLGSSGAPGSATTSATTTSKTGNSIDMSSCGSSKSCFKNSLACKTDCTYLLTWKAMGNEVKFEMSGVSSGYVAVGFSKDQTMGDDNVIVCTSRGSISNRYQSGRNTPGNIDGTNSQFGLSAYTVGSDGAGRVSCSFSRNKTLVTSRRKRAVNPAQMFDLANTYYLFIAVGSIDVNGNPMEHRTSPAVSAKQADFSSTTQVIIGDGPAFAKAHACLMLIAWVGLASISILIARFYKSEWASSTLYGQKVWFTLHRTFMLSAVILNIVALLLILAELSWTWSAQVAHSIIGIIVIGLAFMQPIMAAFRPAPDATSRWIFNWAHWIVGSCAHILSAPAILLGMRTPRLYLPNSVFYVMVAFVVWHVVIDMILEIHKRCLINKNNRPHAIAMDQKNGAPSLPSPPPLPGSSDNPGHRLRRYIIILYGIVTGVLLAVMVIITAKYPN